MDYDEALDLVGGFGRYQWIVFVTLGTASIKSAFNLQIGVLGLYEPKFRCADGDSTFKNNYTSGSDGSLNMHYSDSHSILSNLSFDNSCEGYQLANGTWMNETCNSYVYDKSVMHSTLVSEMDLVCGMAFWPALMLSVPSIGIFIGQIIGALAENFLKLGRKKILIICCTLDAILTPFSAFMPDPTSQLAIKFLRGLSFSLIPYQALILIEEIVATKHRAFVGNNIWLFFCFGYAAMGGIGYLVPVRKTLDLINIIPTFFYILIFFLVPESPRYQIANGQMDKAVKTFRRIAKFNGKNLAPDAITEIKSKEDFFKAMMNYPLMRKKQLILCALAFTYSFCYLGISLNSTFASTNVFVNIFLNGCIEVPSSILAWKLSETKLGRRGSTMLMQCIAGCCIIAVPFLPKQGAITIISTVVALTGKLLLTGAFDVLIVHTVELLPTTIRNIGMLTTTLVNTLGGMLAPYVLLLGKVYHFIPFAIIGGLALCTTLLLCLLPETRGVNLPHTVLEAENFDRHAAVDVKGEDDDAASRLHHEKF